MPPSCSLASPKACSGCLGLRLRPEAMDLGLGASLGGSLGG